jgi:hypothetical protein
MEVEDESKSSMLRKAAREAFPEVDSFYRSPFSTVVEVTQKLEPGDNVLGKLKCIFPSLFFSLSSYE